MTGEGEHVTKNVSVYDTKSGTWSGRDDMISERTDFCAAFVHGRLYAIGGRFIDKRKGAKISEWNYCFA